jgi:NADH:ubiquinone oxidoreductase subunit 3 (subunit A)
MSTDDFPYLFLTIFLGIALAFPLIPIGLAYAWARWMAPAKPGPEKNAIYECGLESKGDAWVQLRPNYYLYAILFLVFDVEAVFLLPFAAAFLGLPVGAFVAMVVFMVLLLEGLVWAWAKGILTWK